MTRTRSAALFFALLFLGLASAAGAANGSISAGQTFPQTALPAPLAAAHRDYLGLDDAEPFTLSRISGRVVLLEILNVHCPHCQQQTQPYNRLYRMIEKDPATRGRIKMLGVAVGNSDEAIDDFVVIYSVPFPVVPDRNFNMHRALRAGPTPFSVYALRDDNQAEFVVTDTHLGVDRDVDGLFAYLKDLLTMKTAEFTSLPQDPVAKAEKLRPPQSDDEIAGLVREAFSGLGRDLQNLKRLKLPSERWVYSASLVREGQRQTLFAEVGNRSAICDVCHSVHFFYIFDSRGFVLNFTPLHLTKYGNVDWNREEIAFFDSRVVGRQMAGFEHFDPAVDAVTRATMTSAIIFDDINRGLELIEELRRENLLPSR